jgi:hypothetical protein
LMAAAGQGEGALTSESAHSLAANPNALIEPAARAALPPAVLTALEDSLASAIHNVFWVATTLAALALLVSFWLPRTERDGAPAQPTEEACSAESCERLVVAEIASLDPEHEPETVATRGD